MLTRLQFNSGDGVTRYCVDCMGKLGAAELPMEQARKPACSVAAVPWFYFYAELVFASYLQPPSDPSLQSLPTQMRDSNFGNYCLFDKLLASNFCAVTCAKRTRSRLRNAVGEVN